MHTLVPVAHGSESLETVAIVNILRRAQIRVTLASVEDTLAIKATRELGITADVRLGDVLHDRFDLIALPGGEKGARALGAHAPLVEMLREQRLSHRWLGAICAAPALVLSPLGLLDGKQATCHPSFRSEILHYVDRPVVVDGHCITSQGPGTALAFALQLVEALRGPDMRREVAQAAVIQ